jgi:hypothetical protein
MNKGLIVAANGHALAMAGHSMNFRPDKSTANDSETTADCHSFSQPITKPNVS